MQEVTIKPKSTFIHYVKIESAGKELYWNFITKKKNISFGLSKQIERSGHRATPSNEFIEKLNRASPRASRVSSTSSFMSFDQTSSVIMPKNREAVEPLDTTPIMPIAHYESSKITVKGSHFVKEPGVYALIFDNSFSKNTAKKLSFFVALRDLDADHAVTSDQFRAYLLKKGNLSMQGYRRRYVQIDPNGTLSYYKGPGRASRGSVNLGSSVVHLNHDHMLIDIDSEQITYHFKAENRSDFEAIAAIVERFNISGSKYVLEHEPEIKNQSARASSYHESLQTLDTMHIKASAVLESMQVELMSLKAILEGSKGKLDTKDTLHATQKTTSLLKKLAAVQSELERMEQLNNNKVQEDSLIYQEAFNNCLQDNNQLRKKYGLSSVVAQKFLPGPVEYVNSPSIMSPIDEDEFYDAEEGEISEDISTDDQFEPIVETKGDADDSDDVCSVASNDLLSEKSHVDVGELRGQVIRRKELPVPASSMENISIMGILRNNVGKDLSTVAMPIVLNEPINLLQKLCEELEYAELLKRAASATDPAERLAIVAGFVVSGYSSTVYRAARKPFNPLLGETYEFDRPDKGFKFISEKVSHHPPIMATHAHSPDFIFYQDSLLKTKFWGKSLELTNIGKSHLEFPALEEHYVWEKVTSSMRNMFSTSRYLEHHGTLQIVSELSGHYCTLTFKEAGYFSSSNNEVTGAVFDKSGKKLLSLSGRWDNSLNKFLDSAPNNLEVIWRIGTFPPNCAENYGFTQFAIELNELTHDIAPLLPKTDTRFRTDQRLYENGRLDDAENEKLRLEQKQRDFRKSMEKEGKSWNPKFFVFDKSREMWIYNNNYWENRGKFDIDYDLFS